MKGQHLLLAIAIAAIWGFNFVVIKVGVGAVPPFLLTGLRFLFAAIPAIFFITRPKESFANVAAYGIVLGVGQFGFLFLAVKLGLSASLASLVMQLQAFFTMLFAWAVLREIPKWFQISGAVVAFSGIGLIAYERWSGPDILPLFLCVIAAAGWAAANIITKRAKPQNTLSFVVWSSLVAPLPLFLLSGLFDNHAQSIAALSHPTSIAMVSIVYLALLSTLFGYAAWNHLLNLYSTSVVAPFSLLVPIFGIVSGVLVLGEIFDIWEMIGAALVMAGLLFSNFGQRLFSNSQLKKAEP